MKKKVVGCFVTFLHKGKKEYTCSYFFKEYENNDDAKKMHRSIVSWEKLSPENTVDRFTYFEL